MRNECGMNKTVFRTPLGWSGIAASDAGIAYVVLPRAGRKAVERELAGARCGTASAGGHVEELLAGARDLLQKYFSGQAVTFDLPVDFRYYTPFQQQVWKATAGIPFGQTRSYQWIAGKIKRPKSARAVGQAMGANPVPILVP